MHWFLCFNARWALIVRCTISIGFSHNLSRIVVKRSFRAAAGFADNPQGGYTNSISSSRPRQLKRACISRLSQTRITLTWWFSAIYEQTTTLPGLLQSTPSSLGLTRTATRSGGRDHDITLWFISVAATLSRPLSDAHRRVTSEISPWQEWIPVGADRWQGHLITASEIKAKRCALTELPSRRRTNRIVL